MAVNALYIQLLLRYVSDRSKDFDVVWMQKLLRQELNYETMVRVII